MTEHDDRLSARYRELGREEPSADLDQAILAASRRALSRPSFARRWGTPVSIAAVLVLAIGVTLRMQLEEPGVESAVPEHAAPAAAPAAPVPAPAQRQERAREKVAPEAPPAPRPRMQSAPVPAPEAKVMKAAEPARSLPVESPPPAAATNAAAPAPAPAPAPAKRVQGSPDAPAAQGLSSARIPPAAADSYSRQERAAADPAAELERIARLRAERRDAEADKALEEFRRSHPGYRIPEDVWERVRPK